jgi:VanZ family protein
MANRYRSWILFFAMLSVVSFLLFFDFGKIYSRTIIELLNFGHLFLFGSSAIFLLWLMNQEVFPPKELSSYVKAGVIITLLGIITEFIQLLTPDRDFELSDMVADGLGAFTFLTIIYSSRENVSFLKKRFLRAGSLLIMVVMLYPVVTVMLDDLQMKEDFPLLDSFESSLEMSRWNAKGTNKMERVRSYATDGEYAMKAVLSSGKYPGVSMDYFMSDWRGYVSLEFDVFSEEAAPWKIMVRINDRKHNEQHDDRYNGNFLLQKGFNHVSISLDKVESAPKGREMDMSAIDVFCIFSSRLKEPRILYVDNFRLKK